MFRIQSMITSSEVVRELPIPPAAFGVIAFGIFVFFLYVVLRLDK